MFKCMDCGNDEKFIGVVREEGRAFIYQNGNFPDNCICGEKSSKISALPDIDTLDWAYIISDKDYRVSHSIERCARCNSLNIKDV